MAVGVADLYFSQIGKFLGFKSMVLTDTEHVKLDKYLVFPFADSILTPKAFNRYISSNPNTIVIMNWHIFIQIYLNLTLAF